MFVSWRNALAELEQNGIFVIIAQIESATFGEKEISCGNSLWHLDKYPSTW